jgi:PEGA domain
VYQLSTSPALLVYMAECLKNVGDHAGVIEVFNELQAVPQADALAAGVAQEDLDKIPRTLVTARRLVVPLRLLVNEPGAEVLIDGKLVGTTPLALQSLLNLGDRKIRVTKQGFKDAEQMVHVESGADVPLSITLERIVQERRLFVDPGPDGFVWLDDKMMDRGPWQGSVTSGGHSLTVMAPSKVIITDDQRLKVTVLPAPQPPAPQPDGMKWVWTGIGLGVAIGVVAGVAGGVGARSSGGPAVQAGPPVSPQVHR